MTDPRDDPRERGAYDLTEAVRYLERVRSGRERSDEYRKGVEDALETYRESLTALALLANTLWGRHRAASARSLDGDGADDTLTVSITLTLNK